MTDRKPPGVAWESWIEQQIRESMERGEFDQLPGAGKPLPSLDRPRDEDWWVKEKLRREDVSFLPRTLAVRKQRDDALARIAAAVSEAAVRQIVDEINTSIRDVNRTATAGPSTALMPLDVEAVVVRWREARPPKIT